MCWYAGGNRRGGRLGRAVGRCERPWAPNIPAGPIYSNRRLPTDQDISNLSVIGLKKPMHVSVGSHVWLRRGEAGFVTDTAREALD